MSENHFLLPPYYPSVGSILNRNNNQKSIFIKQISKGFLQYGALENLIKKPHKLAIEETLGS